MRLRISKGDKHKTGDQSSSVQSESASSSYPTIFIQRIDDSRSRTLLSLPSISVDKESVRSMSAAREITLHFEDEDMYVPGYHGSTNSRAPTGNGKAGGHVWQAGSSGSDMLGPTYSDLMNGGSPGSINRPIFRRTLLGSSISYENMNMFLGGLAISGGEEEEVDCGERIEEYVRRADVSLEVLAGKTGDISKPASNLLEACSRAMLEKRKASLAS